MKKFIIVIITICFVLFSSNLDTNYIPNHVTPIDCTMISGSWCKYSQKYISKERIRLSKNLK